MSEELLNNCRKRNYNLSNFYKNRLFSIYNFDLKKELKEIFSILYFPSIAYFEYCYGNSELGLQYLNNCINFIKEHNELIILPAFKSVICAQMLNCYKCHLKIGNKQEAFLTSRELLMFINNHFSRSEEYENKFMYYLEEIFSKVNNYSLDDIEKIIQTIRNELLSFLQTRYSISDNIFMYDKNFSYIIDKNLEKIKYFPNILKSLILKLGKFSKYETLNQ